MAALAILDWLGNKPWNGETTYFDIIAIVLSLTAGSFVGGRVISISRVRAEARRDLYNKVLPIVREYPAVASECAQWRRSIQEGNRLVSILTWPERRGWRAYHQELPYGIEPDGATAFSKDPRSVSYSTVITLAARVSRADNMIKGEDRKVLESLDEALLEMSAEYISKSSASKPRSALMTYVQHKLRPGWFLRRVQTRLMAVSLVWPRFAAAPDREPSMLLSAIRSVGGVCDRGWQRVVARVST